MCEPLVPVSITELNLSDTHELRSRYGQCGQRAWRGPGGSPRALGIQLQLDAPRASSLPSSNAVARGRDSLAPRAEPPCGNLSGALAQQRVASAVEGAVVLLRRYARGRRPRKHTSKPSTVPVWLRQALQASSHRPGTAPRVLSAAPPPVAPAFCTRSPHGSRSKLQVCRSVGVGLRIAAQAMSH